MTDTLHCEHQASDVCPICRAVLLPDTPEEHRADWHHHAAGHEACDLIGDCPIIIKPWSPTGQGGMT